MEELSLNETDRARLEALRLELGNEEITLKGFLKKKEEIFAPYRSTSDTSGKGEFGFLSPVVGKLLYSKVCTCSGFIWRWPNLWL